MTLEQRRIQQFHNERFCLSNSRLYCRLCRKYISTDLTSIRRHIGANPRRLSFESLKNKTKPNFEGAL